MTSRKQRVGVLSTLVCDVIHGPPPAHDISEGWGGVAYGVSGLGAALDDAWEMVPFIKVGADVADEARAWLRAVPGICAEPALWVVPEPNNRSELRYLTPEHRTEQMRGGVPPWSAAELLPLFDAAELDALYVNFLSGREVDLTTMQRIRAQFSGPIYVDLHMLLWHTDDDGRRSLQPLRDAAAWCACFDFIQVNEEEMRMLAPDFDLYATLTLGAGVLATFVTLGSRGVQYGAHHALRSLADRPAILAEVCAVPPAVVAVLPAARALPYAAGVVPPPALGVGAVLDPTGCGDVWGGTIFARLLAGDSLAQALATANRAASHNAQSQGVVGLAHQLMVQRLDATHVADAR